MASTFVTSNGDTTIKIEFTALTEKIQSIVGDASHYLWDKGFGDHGSEETSIVWADLSNQDKLDLVDEHLKTVIIGLSNTYKSNKAQDDARDLEAESEHTL